MVRKEFVFLLLLVLVMPPSYAGERDGMILSLTPFLKGGIMGIKDASYSPLTYNGPLAGVGLCLSAQGPKMELFLDATASYGWLSNRYHRDPASIYNKEAELAIGVLTGIYDDSIVSVKAGGAFGFLGNEHINRIFNHSHDTFAMDAKMCVHAELNLPRKWSILIEERNPFVAFLSAFNRYQDNVPAVIPDRSFKAFPGNEFRIGICRTLEGGNRIMLEMHHECYSSGNALPDSFRLQFLELGIAFRFGLNNLGHDES